MPTPFSPAALARLQATFVAIVLPRILSHGQVYFHGITCPHRQEDAMQEMIGLAWQWRLGLAEKGKDATCFPTALACYAARAVKSSCRLCGQERANAVLAPLAPQRHPFVVVSSCLTLRRFRSSRCLRRSRTTPSHPPDETLCLKLDFTAGMASLMERNGGSAQDLMIGGRTGDVAD